MGNQNFCNICIINNNNNNNNNNKLKEEENKTLNLSLENIFNTGK